MVPVQYSTNPVTVNVHNTWEAIYLDRNGQVLWYLFASSHKGMFFAQKTHYRHMDYSSRQCNVQIRSHVHDASPQQQADTPASPGRIRHLV